MQIALAFSSSNYSWSSVIWAAPVNSCKNFYGYYTFENFVSVLVLFTSLPLNFLRSTAPALPVQLCVLPTPAKASLYSLNYSHGNGLQLEHCWLSRATFSEETDPSSTRNKELSRIPRFRVELFAQLPSPSQDLGCFWLCMVPQLLWIPTFSYLAVFRKYSILTAIQHGFCPFWRFSYDDPQASGGGVVVYVLHLGLGILSLFSALWKLWVPMLTSICCKQNLPWWGLKGSLIYMYSNRLLKLV